ncbi:PKD domain-containing protein, partial [Methanohalobium sp.]|uniref:Ig-like domain-containing protein n=1 Tax=Methanohalobium sp. TaxID=2837493 RepID=UPI0025D188FC
MTFNTHPHATFPSSSPYFDQVNTGTIEKIDGNNYRYIAPASLASYPFYDTLYVEKDNNYDTTVIKVLSTATNIYNVYEDGSYCSGPGSEVWLSGSENLHGYELYRDGVPVDTIAGDGDSISFGLRLEGEYTVYDTTDGVWMSGSATISDIKPGMASLIYLSDSAYCEGGLGVELGVDTSEVGVDYELHNSESGYITTFGGTGDTLNFGYYTDSAGYYYGIATNGTGTCEQPLNDSLEITIKNVPSVYTLTGPTSLCEGANIELTLSDSENDIQYDLIDQTTGNTDTTIYGDGAALNFTVSDSGSYYVMATDTATLCQNPMNDTINVDKYPTVSLSVSPDSTGICVGDSVQLSASGADTYVWEPSTGLSDDSIADPMAGPTSTQDYSVIGNNSYNCPDTAGVTVTVNSYPTANAGSDTSICRGDSAQLVAGVGYDDYSWNPSSNLSDPDSRITNAGPSTSTTYTVTVTSEEGCSSQDTVRVQVDSVPAPAVNDPSVCFGDSVTLNASGGDSYEWSTGETGSSILVSPPDTSDFTVEAFYDNGCSAKDTSTVSVMPLPSLTTSNDTAICPGTSVELGASASGGSGSYSYEWSTGQSGDTITVSPSTEQDYGVEVEDDNGCRMDDSVNVSISDLPDINVSGLDSAYCNDVSGFTFHATPDSGFYTSPWSDTDIFEDRGEGEAYFNPSNVSSEGTYDITYEATGSNTCTDDTTMQVTVNFVPDVNFSGLPDSICLNADTVLLTGNPESSNGFFTGNGIIDNGDGTAIFDPDSAGTGSHTITYTYTDPNTGCTNSRAKEVYVRKLPEAYAVDITGHYCEDTPGDSISLSGGETNTYYEVIRNGNDTYYDTTLVSSGDFTFDTVFTENTYEVVATSPEGCTNSMLNEVSTVEWQLPDDAYNITGDDIVEVDGIGYYSVDPIANAETYNWIKPSAATIDSGNGTNHIKIDFAGVSPGNYTIEVFGSNSCGVGDTAYFDVEVMSEPADIDSIAGPDTVCAGSRSLIYEAFPDLPEADSIEWSVPTGFHIVSGYGTETIEVDIDSSGASSGYVIAWGVNASGAGGADSLYVIVNSIPEIDNISISDQLDCSKDSVLMVGSGDPDPSDAQYTWTGGGKTVKNDSIYASASGDYTLTINANGCVTDTTVTLTEDTQKPSVNIETPDTLTCNKTSVTLEATSDADDNTEYVWTAYNGANIVSGDSTATPTVDSAGTYEVTVTDLENSCTRVASVEVEDNLTKPSFDLSDPQDITCERDTSVISATTVSDATYQWSGPEIIDGQGTSSVTVKEIGEYTLKVTYDDNGCSRSKSRTVEADSSAPTDVSLTKSGDITCDTNQVSLEASTNTSNVSYDFYPLSTGNIVDTSGNTALVDKADDYAVTVTKNSTGCTTEDTTTVNDNRHNVNANITAVYGEITCNEPYDTLRMTSDLTDKTVKWSASNGGNIISGALSPEIVVNAAGTYSVTVTDTITGCTGTNSIDISEDITPPTIHDITRDPNEITCTEDVNLVADVSGYSSLLWTTSDGGNITPDDQDSVYVDAPGTYKLEATADNGCTTTDYIDVPADTASPQMTLTTNYEDITCSNTHDTLEVSSTTPNVTYHWSKVPGSGSGTITDVTSKTPVVDGSGTFEIVITGDNGCTTDSSVTVDTNYTTSNINYFDNDPEDISCKNHTVELEVDVYPDDSDLLWTTDGIGDIDYETTENPIVDAPGDYTVTVTHPETGCSIDSTVTVERNDSLPEAVIDKNVSRITCEKDTVHIDGSASEGINFEWTSKNGNILSDNTLEKIIVGSDGWYILTVEHPTSGCTDKDSVEVEAAQNVPYILMGYMDTDTLTCKNPELEIPVDSVDVPDYWWTTSDGNIVSGDSSLNVTVDEPGTYTFHAIDSITGCTNSKSVEIYEDKQKPNVSFSSDTLTCSVDTVRIESRIEYANDPTKVTFQWSGGDIVPGDEDLPNPRVTSAATYNVTVTDEVNGCQRITSHEVGENTTKPAININKDPEDITCERSEVTLEDNTGQTDVSYKWTTTGDGNIANPNTPTPTVDDAGWYTLRITKNNNGCYREDSVEVDTNYYTPSVFIDPVDDITCSNPEVELEGGSPDSVSYKWTGPSITGNDESRITTADEGGYYTLTVTDKVTGCKNDSTVKVIEDNTPPSAPMVGDTGTCEGSSNVPLTATGTNIKWYDDATLTNQVGSGDTYTPAVSAPGDYAYYATQTGANGCESDAASAIYSIYELPGKPTTQDESICYGEPNPFMEAYPSNSNYDIHWYNSSDSLLSVSDSYKPTQTDIGTYEFGVTQVDMNGCESEQEDAYFTINDIPSAPVVEEDTLEICYGSDNKSFVAHGDNIKWYDSEPPANAIAEGNIFTPDENTTGTYTYYVTQSNSSTGCESSYTEVTYIILPNPAKFDLLGGGTFCEGTGGVEVYLDDSENSVTYDLYQDGNAYITNINGDGDSISFGNITADGTYTAYATGDNGCSLRMSGTAIVDMEPLPEEPGTITGDSVVCEGSTIDYTVPEIEYAEYYIWSVPAGSEIVAGDNSRTISVSYSDTAQNGMITVYGTNSCGDGEESVGHAITVNNLPDSAGSITGPDEICQGADNVSFEVDKIDYADEYEWTLPSGATITSGEGTRMIVVNFDESTTGGIVKVKGKNECGYGEESPKHEISVNSVPEIVTDFYKSICSASDSLIAEDPGGSTTILWELIEGHGIIDAPNSFETEVTDLGNGINKFTVTLDNGTCSVTDTVIIENNQVSVNAGANKELCEDVDTLNGSQPPEGATGNWSVQKGKATFQDANSYSTAVEDLARGENVLRWTITKNGCESYDEVTLINNSPTEAEAGISRELCKDSAYLDANIPKSDEYGEWSIVNGFVDFANINDPGTKITDISNGDNTLKWTITKNNCSSSDSVIITNNQTEVDAGEDQILCSYRTDLNATAAPSGATGMWEIVDGSANFDDPEAPDTEVYLGSSDTTILRWGVNIDGCISYDSVMLINNSPYPVNAGPNQVVFQFETHLEATTPEKGTGVWTLLEGGGEFADETDPKTEVTELAYGKNKFQWTVTYEDCIERDTVVVDNQYAGDITAGEDTIICTNQLRLNASDPEQGEGEWSVVDGSANFEDKNDPNTLAKNLSKGDNVLRWTVYGNGVVSDEVTITNNSPTEASAGPDMTYCADSAQLTANSPTIGEGSWELIGGSGTFEDSTKNNTMVYGLSAGTNTFRWKVTHEGCESTDDVVITNNTPTEADAGDDMTLCSDETVLYGNAPVEGEGLWTLVSGSESVTFQDQTVGNTVVENLGHGDNVLRWTITKGECSSYDDVTITNNNPSEANAGRDKSICVDTFNLNANDPSVGTGKWRVITGYGEFDDTLVHNTTIRELSKGSNILRWTIEHEGCESYDEVEISNDMIESDAGIDQSICVDSTSLSANNPAPGDGYWSVITGSANFEDHNNPDTDVSGLDYMVENQLKWTIVNESCVSKDTVTIQNNHPGIVYAGKDKDICDHSVTLQANPNYIGVGVWEPIVGGGDIHDPGSPSTDVTDLELGENTFRWTVTRNGCIYSDDVTITNNMPVQAYAGEDDSTCSDSYELYAEEPPFGQGKWTVVAGSGEFEEDSSSSTTVNNMAQGTNTYKWTIYNGQCSTSDEVSIAVNKPDIPNAGPDKSVCSDSTYLQGNHPSYGQTGYWEIVEGSASFEDENDPKTKVTGLNYGRNVLRWNIEKNGCTLYDEVTIQNNSPTVAFAGDDMHVCGDETRLNAQEPTIGTGEWSLVSGTAEIEDKYSANSKVKGLGFGPNTLRWTTKHNGCTSIDEVIVYNDLATAYAGEDQSVYEPEAYMVGNTPSRGDGEWIILGGSGTFEHPDSAQTKVSDLAPGENTFRWKITNNSCVAFDEVSITYYEMPKVEFTLDTNEGCPPLTVQFLNKSLNANSQFTWDFGDNNISKHENPRHTYYSPGEYTVELSTTGPDGSKVTDDTTVIVHNKPEADFEVAPHEVYI